MMKIDQLRVAYGPFEVIKGVSLTIDPGTVTALIGSNGAGKTTILNTICGLVSPLAGSIIYDGKPIGGLQPEEIVRLGVVQVPEGRKVFRNLTVYECLLMGGLCQKDKKRVARDIEEMFVRFPRLRERSGQMAGTLSGGEQQMLAFGRALVARPKLLLLDEPSMGLAPQVVQDIATLITEIGARGVTVMLVEQNAELALGLSNTAYVLETGRIALSGPARDLLANPDVRRAYLGV